MPDFAEVFADCRTIQETNVLYKTLFAEHCSQDADLVYSLAEAHRRAMDRLRPDSVDQSLGSDDPDHIRPHTIRNWAMREGMPMPKRGRVPVNVENAYREAHGMELRPERGRVDVGDGTVSLSEVRRWALQQEIPVSSRGRLPRTIMDQYVAAHAEVA